MTRITLKRRCPLLWLLAISALWISTGCRMEVSDGRYLCDPEAGGVCPTGWSCLPVGTRYECHRTDTHLCGDGVIQPGEQCDGADNIPGTCAQYGLDDGNLQCTSVCTVLCTSCGNGAVETGPFGEGEACDDENLEARDGCSPDCRMENPTWIRQQPETSPSARAGHTLVYDAHRQVAILFGGRSGTTLLNDTWEYDGTTWVQVPTTNAPSGRTGHAMAYDSDRQVTVLFGGAEQLPAAVGLADTWEYDGVDWTLIPADPSPSYRLGAVAAYDPLAGVTILHGGIHNGIYQPATWEFDGTSWQYKIFDVAPGDRSHASMVWAPAWQGVVLFGGNKTLLVSLSFDDTWLYKDGSWEKLLPQDKPPSRQGHAAFFDPLRQRLVIFGGAPRMQGEPLPDLWEFDGQQWTAPTSVGTLPPRSSAAVYLPEQSQALMFGGQTADASGPGLDDTWWLLYRAGDSVCGDGDLGADEICDGTQISNQLGLSCEVLGYTGGDLACRGDCRLDLSGCTD